jgi:hypothetical protein
LITSPDEIKAWFDRHAIVRSANSLAFDPQRARRQPYRTDWSRALQLNDPQDRPVIVDTASAARPVKASEREQLAKYKVPRCLGVKGFSGSRAKCEQGEHYYRTPRDHTVSSTRPPDESGQLNNSQITKSRATTFLIKG